VFSGTPLAAPKDFFRMEAVMGKLAWIALCGLVAVAACTSNTRTDTGASAGASAPERSTGSSVTTAPAGREDMRNSKDDAPGAEGDRQKPAPAGAPRRTY
jgi:hypothetical protein